MKFVKRYPKGGATMFLIACIIIACGTSHEAKKVTHTPSLLTASVVPIHSKQDTPKVKPRTWSPQQLEYFIGQQYQANYNKFFAPEFKRLNGVVDKQSSIIQEQANSLRLQAEYMIIYRHRMDSIARERNSLRLDVSRQQDSQVYWQKQAIKSQRELIDFIHTQSKENKTQVNTNTILSICCMVGVLIIGGLFIYLKKEIKKVSDKINGLEKNYTNV